MVKFNKGKSIGLILTYNSASTLKDVYQRLPHDVLDEVIVIDDESSDNTLQVAKELGIRFFAHEHRGYGGNIKFGLMKALEMGGEYMIEIHGDGQYDQSVIPVALDKMSSGCDFILGSRFTNPKQALEDGMSFVRYFANRGLSFFDRLFLGIDLTEFHNGFRVYSRKLLETADFRRGAEDFLFSFEIIVQARYFNLRVCEVPVRCDYTQAHTSINLWKSAIYSFQTFYVLFLYYLARFGIKIKLFRTPEK